MKTITVLHMPFSMGMGRAAVQYIEIFKKMGYQVSTMNWYDFMQNNRKHMEPADILFAFVVPQNSLLPMLQNIIKHYTFTCGMTAWETEDPPECFKQYTKMFDVMTAPSQFTIDKFDPTITFVPHHVSTSSYQLSDINTGLKQLLASPGYKFYSISDFTDSRKNVAQLVRGFLDCALPNALLVLKHNRTPHPICSHPKIINIIGEMTKSDIEFIHDVCHCYVNLSFSEGVGLGILEAAVRNKPIIMTDYGGQNDYVTTPWLVKTTVGKIGFDEFLFSSDMRWGIPHLQDYKRIMKDVYLESPETYDHERTRKIVSQKNIKKLFTKLF